MSTIPAELTAWAAGNPVHAALAAAATLFVVLCVQAVLGSDKPPSARKSSFPAFKPTKKLTVKDQVFLAFLAEHDQRDGRGLPSYVITDPTLPDNPIVYASEGFTKFTLYETREIVGRNCRFLQGPNTDAAHVAIIRSAIQDNKECSVQLLNYKKNGDTFINQFFLLPLKRSDGPEVAYYIGVQKEVSEEGSGKEGENSGWRIFMWLG